MRPLKDSEYLKIQNKQDDVMKYGNGDSTLLFRWYVWKSHRKAQVKFATPAGAEQTVEAFKVNPKLDGVEVSVQLDKKNAKVINIDNLRQYTDELYIE